MPTKWRDYSIEVYSGALSRHLLQEAMGELSDPESGFLHAGHAAWNALAKFELMLTLLKENDGN